MCVCLCAYRRVCSRVRARVLAVRVRVWGECVVVRTSACVRARMYLCACVRERVFACVRALENVCVRTWVRTRSWVPL